MPAGTEVTLASSLFPIGGMAVWAEPGAVTDLNGAFVEGSVTIVHRREVIQADGSTAEQQVQLGSLEFRLQGQADGTARFTLSINGQLVLDNVLADVPVGPLAGLAGGQIFIPALPIPYQYAAIVGDANTDPASVAEIGRSVGATAIAIRNFDTEAVGVGVAWAREVASLL